MTHRPLPIMRTLTVAYRDWRHALVALRLLVLCTFLILVALDAIAELVPQSLWGQNLIGQALDLAADAIWAILLTPVVVAVHRYVIQDVVTPGYTLPLGDLVYQKVFVWLFALKVLSGLPFDLLGVMQALELPLWAARLGLSYAGRGHRSVAAADDFAAGACGAGAWRDGLHALADSKGQALRLAAIFFLALMPWVAVSLCGILLLGRRIEVTGSPQMMVGLVMGGLLQTSILTLSAVIASHAFRSLAAAVNRAPKLVLAPAVNRHSLD